MKRAFSILLIALLLCFLAVPAMAAAGEAIAYTSDSSFVAGGTVKVDKEKTMANIYSKGTSDEYNAFLEGRVQYYWMRNDSYYADGMTLTLTENDKACQFYCVAALYGDADHTQQIGTITGAKFTVPNTTGNATIPEIRDAAIPDGKVGQSYYVKLDCSDPDVVFSLFRSSLPDGLYLTQHGEIEGTPTKAGFWYVVIMATPEAGEDYACTREFEITIAEDGSDYTLEIVQLPNKIVYTAGEKLDMTGLKVRIYTPDGFIDSKDGKGLTYSQKELVTVGEQKIKIFYQDAFEFFIVTVVAAPTTEPTEPDTTTKPTEPDTTATPTEPDMSRTPTDSTENSTDGTESQTDRTENPTDSTENPTDGTGNAKPKVDTTDKNDEQNDQGMPWWGILLIALVAAGAGIGITIFVLKKKET